MYIVRVRLLIFIFFVAFSARANQGKGLLNKQFDSVFYDAVLRVSSLNLVKAERIADSLYVKSKSKDHELKALILKASILEKQNKREEAIGFAVRAAEKADIESDYKWLSIIYGFLSKQYRLIGLSDYSQEFLKKSEEAAKKMEDKTQAAICFGMLFQEKALQAFNRGELQEAIKFLHKSNKFFLKLKLESDQTKNFFAALNHEMIGTSFVKLTMHDSARYYYDKSLKFLDKAGLNNSQHEGAVCHGKALIFLEEGNYKQAKLKLDKAYKVATSNNYKELLQKVYRDLARYYKEVGDFNNYTLYHEKYTQVKENTVKASKIATNAEVNRIFKEQEVKVSVLYWFLSGVLILFLFGLGVFFTQKIKFKKEQQFFDAFMSKVQNSIESEKNSLTTLKIDKPKNQNKSTEERLMSTETETLILKKLKEFENKNEYTDNKLTLTKLSAKFDVNSKYLSWVINEHKKKDFNNYINQLRILYIIDKIKTDPEYINYKISYLSLESGFSSHSKFTSIFKKETGLTPSLFIDQVKKESVTV